MVCNPLYGHETSFFLMFVALWVKNSLGIYKIVQHLLAFVELLRYAISYT